MPGVQTKGGAGVAKPSFERLELELKLNKIHKYRCFLSLLLFYFLHLSKNWVAPVWSKENGSLQ